MHFSLRLLAATLAASLSLAPSVGAAHPVTVDGSAAEWLARTANGDNLGLVARASAGQGSYVWRDPTADTRTDVSSPEVIADLTRVQATASATGLSFFVSLNGANAHTASQPVQLQIAIDADQLSGSGQNFFAGFADMVVPEGARWERLIQTQFTAGTTARVIDAAFSVTGSLSVGVASSASGTQLEFTVPWSLLGLSAPPSTPLRFTIATFRERAGGDTVDIGGSSIPNALDVVSDYGAPGTSPNTFSEFSSAGDNRLDYSFDLYFNSAGEVYAPLLVTRYVSNAANDATGGGEWVVLRNMTPQALQLSGYRLSDEETAGGTEGARSLPSVALAAGATFVAAESGASYFGRFGRRPDGEWTSTDAMVPDLLAYSAWAGGSIALGNTGDELLVLDRSHTAADIVVYGSGAYAGVTAMTAPGASAAASRSATTFADTDNCATDFSTSSSLCATDADCGGCGTCNLNVCAPRAAGFVCRASAGSCDVAEACDGAGLACPSDTFASSSTVCRASAGSCDVAESCTGTSAACPTDLLSPSTTVCRASAGACDVAETCDGVTAACPMDSVASMLVVCRPGAGSCDVAETCDGVTTACPIDFVASSTTVCRASNGVCDVAESCDGATAACPVDTFVPSTTVCRASGGVCDVAESCTGSSAACPMDTVAPSTTVCRASGGACDVAETCDGATAACPTDTFAPSTTVCRASAGACDVAESCTGSAASCPTDTVSPSTTVCRASAGACDVAESCDGATAACPVDTFAPSTTVCRASGGVCDVAESCTGSSAACPMDTVAPSTTVCRASAGVCDVAESCDGSTAACPTDTFASSTTVCRASGGVCDVAETCTGSTAACPTDLRASTTTVCRPRADACDVAETCDGASESCPANVFAASGASCADGDRCDGDETCNGSGVCVDGTPVLCPPSGEACRANTCVASTGACVASNVMAGVSCSDGNICNGEETCNGSGVCVMGAPAADAGAICADAGDASADGSDGALADVSSDVTEDGATDVTESDSSTTDVTESDAAAADASDAAIEPDAMSADATTEDAATDGAIDASVDDSAIDASVVDSSDDVAVEDRVAIDVRDANNGRDATTDVSADTTGAEGSGPSGGGCGCRTAPGATPVGADRWAALAMGLALAAFASRRRRAAGHSAFPNR